MTPRISPLKHSDQTVSAPYVIPPTNASNVTWMLLNITWNENADAVSVSKSRPSTGGSAADWNSAGIRPAAAGASTSAPDGAQQRRHEQQRPRGEEQRRTLGQSPPVAARQEAPDRRPPAGARIHGCAAPQHQGLQAPDQRVARIAPAHEREVRGGSPIQLAEPPDAARPEPFRPVLRHAQHRVELTPSRRALGFELLRAHQESPDLGRTPSRQA